MWAILLLMVVQCTTLTSANYGFYDDYMNHHGFEMSHASGNELPADASQLGKDDYYNYQYNYGDVQPGDARSSHYDDYRYKYRNYRKPHRTLMRKYERSYESKPKKVFVPVVIKKKTKKKRKILSTHAGFYIPGGTQMFGKFKDLHSCKKACEITPTCFAGDFNPWIGKCYLHSNITSCASMRSHKAITHFKKIPCQVLESTRGIVVLGVSVILGIEMKGIDTLADCIKKCATAGGGVASETAMVVAEAQICCHLDYDFSSHKCFFHLCVDDAITLAQFCPDPVTEPLNAIPNPSTISITICPLAA